MVRNINSKQWRSWRGGGWRGSISAYIMAACSGARPRSAANQAAARGSGSWRGGIAQAAIAENGAESNNVARIIMAASAANGGMACVASARKMKKKYQMAAWQMKASWRKQQQ